MKWKHGNRKAFALLVVRTSSACSCGVFSSVRMQFNHLPSVLCCLVVLLCFWRDRLPSLEYFPVHTPAALTAPWSLIVALPNPTTSSSGSSAVPQQTVQQSAVWMWDGSELLGWQKSGCMLMRWLTERWRFDVMLDLLSEQRESTRDLVSLWFQTVHVSQLDTVLLLH